MNTRESDEKLLIQFVIEQGWDESDLVEAANRLNDCIEKGMQNYSINEASELFEGTSDALGKLTIKG